MPSSESRKGLGEPIFFIIFIVSPLIVVGITVFAILSNSLLAIAFALPYVLVMPIWFYIDVRVNRKLLGVAAKYAVGLLISFITIFSLTSFGVFWMPQFLWASFTFTFTAVFIMSISSLLCERFIKPKLELGV